MNKLQINNSLKNFTFRYDSFCKEFEKKLNDNQIKKNEADKFYYISTENDLTLTASSIY
jgi:hypothetical protein